MTVEIEADDITPSINQETGIITFSIGNTTPLGDYVATIACGEAEPKEITITVTAPTVESLTAATLTLRFTALNRAIAENITRNPILSQGTITYAMSNYNECFEITRTAENQYSARYRTYVDKFSIKQIAATQIPSGETLTLDFTCGDVTLSVPVTPYS